MNFAIPFALFAVALAVSGCGSAPAENTSTIVIGFPNEPLSLVEGTTRIPIHFGIRVEVPAMPAFGVRRKSLAPGETYEIEVPAGTEFQLSALYMEEQIPTQYATAEYLCKEEGGSSETNASLEGGDEGGHKGPFISTLFLKKTGADGEQIDLTLPPPVEAKFVSMGMKLPKPLEGHKLVYLDPLSQEPIYPPRTVCPDAVPHTETIRAGLTTVVGWPAVLPDGSFLFRLDTPTDTPVGLVRGKLSTSPTPSLDWVKNFFALDLSGTVPALTRLADTIDFDGDGVGNLAELTKNSNPFRAPITAANLQVHVDTGQGGARIYLDFGSSWPDGVDSAVCSVDNGQAYDCFGGGGQCVLPNSDGSCGTASVGSHALKMIIQDKEGFQSTLQKSFSVTNQTSGYPVAVISPLASTPVATGTTVNLFGDKSYDPNGKPLTYEWMQTGGYAVALSQNGGNAKFLVPTQAAGTTLSFKLVVHNGNSSSDPAHISVPVQGTSATYSVSGSVGGLNGSVILRLSHNGINQDLTINANGPFAFPTAIANGSNYSVTVHTQPTSQTCGVGGATSGTIAGSAISNLTVSCTASTYMVGGTLSGLDASRSVAVKNYINHEIITLNANGAFTFPSSLASGNGYQIGIWTQPTGQFCEVTNANGTISSTHVSNVQVACVTAHSIGGTAMGLAGTVRVVLKSGGSVVGEISPSSNGTFTFSELIPNNGDYEAVLAEQPVGLACTITKASGVATAPVTSIAVFCGQSAALTAGNQHACALTNGGGVNCWGSNGQGQVGTSTPTIVSSPTAVSGITSAVAVTAGLAHSCALNASGVAHCWGDNAVGQLGNGTTTDAVTPQAVNTYANAPSFMALAAGASHTCAVTRGEGYVMCWGDNSNSQLGNTEGSQSTGPSAAKLDVSTPLSGITAVAAGDNHTCALRSADGKVFCWGLGDKGQLGNGTYASFTFATEVPGIADAVAVAAGGSNTCVVRKNSQLMCWGDNSQGQAGIDGGATYQDLPVSVKADASTALTGASALAVGVGRVCARVGGGIKCWGSGSSGALGNGAYANVGLPASVSSPSDPFAVATGFDFTCALSQANGLWCWGDNSQGQLGDGGVISGGTHTPSAVPGTETWTLP